MVQLNILSGKKAGTSCMATRFPFQMGREASMDLCLDDEGVWGKHFEITMDRNTGFWLKTQAENSFVVVNGKRSRELILRNGDTIEIGALKMRFWLGETRQADYRFREMLTWAGIIALCVMQLVIVYRLAR
jgi:predicted component of type VI protein secretion system